VMPQRMRTWISGFNHCRVDARTCEEDADVMA